MPNQNGSTLACLPDLAPDGKTPERCQVCAVLNYAVCGALSPGELTKFHEFIKHVEVSEGTTLAHDGDMDDSVFSLTSGCLKSYKQLPDGRRQVTGFYFPGDFIGLGSSMKYQADVEAVNDVTLCEMRRSDLERLQSQIPNLDQRLHEMTSSALAKVQGQLVMLGRKSARERLATFLLMLSKRAYQRGVTANPVDVPMNREDIADFLGLTTETVSRTFSMLRKLELIGPDADRKIEILDRAGLERVADGF